MDHFIDKKEKLKKFKSMSSQERKKLIAKKMKAKGIEIGSGVPNKNYENDEVYELIHIASFFPELREN